MAKYANYQKLCDFIFTIFTILWIVTRIGVYPFWIIYRYVLIFIPVSINIPTVHTILIIVLCITAHP